MKTAIIKTTFWDDSGFEKLHIDSKLMYFYLLANPARGLCHIIKLNSKIASAYTGLSIDQIQISLDQLIKEGLIAMFDKYYILLADYVEAKRGRFTQKVIDRELKEVPEEAIDYFNNYTGTVPVHNNKDNSNSKDIDKNKNNKETVSTEADKILDSNCDLVISEWNKVNSTSLKSKREFRENLGFWLSEGYTIEEILYAIRRKVLVPDKFLKDISIVTFFRKSNSQGACNYIEQVLNFKLGEADGTKQRPDEHALEMHKFGETRYTIADLGSDRIDYLNGKGFELEKATGFIKRKEDGYTKSYIVYADGTLKDLID